MILITGGTGFVGRSLVTALVRRGSRVRVLTRGVASASMPAGVDVTQGDLGDPASLEAAFASVETVVHLAARVGTSGAQDAYAFNVQAAQVAARSARAAGVRRFVHVSSGGVYGDGATAQPHRETDPPNPATAYERSKLESESAVLDALSGSAVSWVILRPAGIYGADRPATMSFYREVRRRRLWIHGSPNVIVHPTHVSDVVQACVHAIDRPGVSNTIINVAGERAFRFQELIAFIASALGVHVKQFVMPPAAASVARTAGTAFRAIGLGVPSPIDRVGRAYINRALDTTRAREILDFVPTALEPEVKRIAATL